MQHTMDDMGNWLPDLSELTEGMTFPVRCTRCRSIYDSATVTVTARYSDCSVWVSPCCNQTVDDRPAGWVARPDIEKLNKP